MTLFYVLRHDYTKIKFKLSQYKLQITYQTNFFWHLITAEQILY